MSRVTSCRTQTMQATAVVRGHAIRFTDVPPGPCGSRVRDIVGSVPFDLAALNGRRAVVTGRYAGAHVEVSYVIRYTRIAG